MWVITKCPFHFSLEQWKRETSSQSRKICRWPLPQQWIIIIATRSKIDQLLRHQSYINRKWHTDPRVYRHCLSPALAGDVPWEKLDATSRSSEHPCYHGNVVVTAAKKSPVGARRSPQWQTEDHIVVPKKKAAETVEQSSWFVHT